MLAWILFTLLSAGSPALEPQRLHQVDAAARPGWRPAQRHRRQPHPDRPSPSIGTPIGVMAGTYLAEDGGRQRASANRALRQRHPALGASILIGLFVYQLLVVATGGFSGWAGSWRWRSSSCRSSSGPPRTCWLGADALREAAFALGAPQWKVISSSPGARRRPASSPASCSPSPAPPARPRRCSSPRSATTAGRSTCRGRWPLPVAIYPICRQPFDDWVALAWAGALLITVGVLTLNILTRVVWPRR